MSAIEAGTRDSIGAMQKPWTARAAARDTKDLASAAQKHVTISPTDVTIYIGRFPTFTARLLHRRLATAMATRRDPWRPMVNCCKGMPNSSESGVRADVRRGPIAVMPCQSYLSRKMRLKSAGTRCRVGLVQGIPPTQPQP